MAGAAAGGVVQEELVEQVVPVWVAAGSTVHVPLKLDDAGVISVPRSSVPPPVSWTGLRTDALTVAVVVAALAGNTVEGAH